MPVIRPFKGVQYNLRKIRDISKVVAPPYDIISKKMQEDLYRSSRYNMVRLELGKSRKGDSLEDNRYTRSGRNLALWLRSGVMVRDKSESIYVYSQRYRIGKKTIDRTGFIALMGLDDKDGSKVLPHENTLAAPKKDRLDLMREAKANLSPVFMLYEDPGHKVLKIVRDEISRKKAVIDFTESDIRHRLWKIGDPKAICAIQKLMLQKEIFIADGHHRFETARNYSKEAQASGISADSKLSAMNIMVYFAESDEDTLTVLPAHRVIKDARPLKTEDILPRLEKYFTVRSAPALGGMMRGLSSMTDGHAFGLYLGNSRYYVLRLKRAIGTPDKGIKGKPKEWKRLDVSILHKFVFERLLGVSDSDENIEFIKDPADTVKFVDSGNGEAAFFLNPTKVSEVKRIARIGQKMPRKSTYFYPKPISGLVINKH